MSSVDVVFEKLVIVATVAIELALMFAKTPPLTIYLVVFFNKQLKNVLELFRFEFNPHFNSFAVSENSKLVSTFDTQDIDSSKILTAGILVKFVDFI